MNELSYLNKALKEIQGLIELALFTEKKYCEDGTARKIYLMTKEHIIIDHFIIRK